MASEETVEDKAILDPIEAFNRKHERGDYKDDPIGARLDMYAAAIGKYTNSTFEEATGRKLKEK